jgi:hypothetical protein
VKIIPEDLGSWLKYIHVEYLSDEDYANLLRLDINDSGQQDALIARAFTEEFSALNEVSKRSLIEVLDELPTFPQENVREMLWSAGPLAESLQDYLSFFRKVRAECAPYVR